MKNTGIFAAYARGKAGYAAFGASERYIRNIYAKLANKTRAAYPLLRAFRLFISWF